jgi:DNA glycosylase AlkZ-like
MRGLTPDSLHRLRERRFRRLPARRVYGERDALAFVRDVGFCSTFYRFPEGVACLWEAVAGKANPRWPRHSHHDAGIGLTWGLKDSLPGGKRVYYGKLLKGRPLLVALDLFPLFYALVRGRQRARDYTVEYEAGRLSHTARRIMDAMLGEHPQYTRELRANVFMLEPSKTRAFERAMAELQQGLWLVKSEERYEPTFSYRWDLLEAWLPERVAEGRRLSREAAVAGLIERYTRGAVFTTERQLARLFGLRADEVARAVKTLVRAGTVRADCAIDGWPGRWLIHAAAVPAEAHKSPRSEPCRP